MLLYAAIFQTLPFHSSQFSTNGLLATYNPLFYNSIDINYKIILEINLLIVNLHSQIDDMGK